MQTAGVSQDGHGNGLTVRAAAVLRLAKGVERDSRHILNHFRYKLTSGRIEGVNSMIARVLHKTRGAGSVDYLRLMLRALTSPAFRFVMGSEASFA